MSSGLKDLSRRATDRVRAQDGFSLIELLVVILILGILVGVAVPSFASQKSKAYDVSAMELAHTAQVAAMAYATDHGGEFTWGAEPKGLEELRKYEPSLIACPNTGDACLLQAEEYEEGKGYRLVAEAANTGDRFTITLHSSGVIDHTCTSSKTGCSGAASGSW
ncbi:MAG: type II secretion system protein [Solirubrobacteraceae bacterium]